MKHLMEKLERLLELGGIKKNIVLLAVSGAAVFCSSDRFRSIRHGLPFFCAAYRS